MWRESQEDVAFVTVLVFDACLARSGDGSAMQSARYDRSISSGLRETRPTFSTETRSCLPTGRTWSRSALHAGQNRPVPTSCASTLSLSWVIGHIYIH